MSQDKQDLLQSFFISVSIDDTDKDATLPASLQSFCHRVGRCSHLNAVSVTALVFLPPGPLNPLTHEFSKNYLVTCCHAAIPHLSLVLSGYEMRTKPLRPAHDAVIS